MGGVQALSAGLAAEEGGGQLRVPLSVMSVSRYARSRWGVLTPDGRGTAGHGAGRQGDYRAPDRRGPRRSVEGLGRCSASSRGPGDATSRTIRLSDTAADPRALTAEVLQQRRRDVLISMISLVAESLTTVPKRASTTGAMNGAAGARQDR
jgi:hypothetical protein